MTPSRFRKIKQVLARRQPDLTVVMDKVHKPHNLAAIARSCDAVGVLSLHAVTDQTEIHLRQKAAMGAGHWLTVIRHERVENALEALKASGHQIVAAVAGEDAKDYRDIDYTCPTAFVVGTELYGLSDRAMALSDRQVCIAMQGMVSSLNVSVASALLLFEAERQRAKAGLYNRRRLSDCQFKTLAFEWAHPDIAYYCARRGQAYPELDEEGFIVAERD